MTKKRNLTTFMIAIIIMLFSLPVNAQGTVGYAQWDEENKALTFKGGGIGSWGHGSWVGHGDRYIGSLFRVDEPVRVPRGACLYIKGWLPSI